MKQKIVFYLRLLLIFGVVSLFNISEANAQWEDDWDWSWVEDNWEDINEGTYYFGDDSSIHYYTDNSGDTYYVLPDGSQTACPSCDTGGYDGYGIDMTSNDDFIDFIYEPDDPGDPLMGYDVDEETLYYWDEMDLGWKKGGDGTVINHETQAYANLTDAEKALAKAHPGPAASVYVNTGRAFEITQLKFPNVLHAHNNAADAFRHAYFSALNTRSIGSDLTYQFGVAHEDWDGNPALERGMDLANNNFGINTAGANPCMSHAELADHIYNAVSNGQLVMIENGQLVPTSIP